MLYISGETKPGWWTNGGGGGVRIYEHCGPMDEGVEKMLPALSVSVAKSKKHGAC